VPAVKATVPVWKASYILMYAHYSCRSFLTAFEADVQRRAQERGTRRGTTTDEQQDLLRAMLVFSAAGFDAMLKQLIRDSVPSLARINEHVNRELITFAERNLRVTIEDLEGNTVGKFLASVLTSDDPRHRIIEAYVADLTGGSLQSASELKRVLKALGVDPAKVMHDERQLQEAFKVRNEIIHGLDMNFEQPNRNRQSRTLSTMVDLTNTLFEVASRVVDAVEANFAR
jgi:hypothetical protein